MSMSADIKNELLEAKRRAPCCEDAFNLGLCSVALTEKCPDCPREYMAGVFVARGTMTDPAKSYYLSIKADKPLAERLEALLRAAGLPPLKSPLKGDSLRLYFKESEKIEDFLTYIGASKFTLEMVELDVLKTLRNKENRISNAEYANMDRTAMAAAEQLKAIKLLRERGMLTSLPEELAKTAKLREENPSMPLNDLCRRFSPSISKSGLNHRLKRLIEEAERLRAEGIENL